MTPIRPTAEMFDRLADDELSETQRAELLSSLDHEPEGWRNCALAFLEAQCWRKALSAMRQNAGAAKTPASSAVAASPRPARRRSSPLGLAGTLAAMAATFLLALSTGISWLHRGQIAGSSRTASDTQIAASKAGSPTNNAVPPVQWVRLSPAGSADAAEAINLPAQERDRIDPKWLQSLPSPLPENVVQALQRSGYKVLTQQELMPMPLKDGRRLVVPVDKVQLRYVGNTTY